MKVSWGNAQNEPEEGNITHSIALVLLEWLFFLVSSTPQLHSDYGDEENVNEGCISVG